MQYETVEDESDQVKGSATEKVAEPMTSARDAARNSYDLVPVGPRGAAPVTLDQQISYAEAMSKGAEAIPMHLRKNIGACLAVVDIATRANLSPYMVANKTYVQNDRLCFESQLIHALIDNSGILQGRLRIEYEGEIADGSRRCIVSGLMKGERVPHVHRGGSLAEVHPGFSYKTEGNSRGKKISYADGMAMIAAANGAKVDGLFVNGSPLWLRKPDVQLAYDTVRDWGRLHAPGALMGITDPHEMIEYDGVSDTAREVNPVDANVLHRLPGAQNGEGFNHSSVHAELDQVVGMSGGAKPEPAKDDKPKRGKQSVTAKAVEKKADPKVPSNAEEYRVYAEAWIKKEKDPDNAIARWDGEREQRDELKVPVKVRKALEDQIGDKFGAGK